MDGRRQEEATTQQAKNIHLQILAPEDLSDGQHLFYNIFNLFLLTFQVILYSPLAWKIRQLIFIEFSASLFKSDI